MKKYRIKAYVEFTAWVEDEADLKQVAGDLEVKAYELDVVNMECASILEVTEFKTGEVVEVEQKGSVHA